MEPSAISGMQGRLKVPHWISAPRRVRQRGFPESPYPESQHSHGSQQGTDAAVEDSGHHHLAGQTIGGRSKALLNPLRHLGWCQPQGLLALIR